MEVAMDGNGDNTSLRVASFSCYLDTTKHKISAHDSTLTNLPQNTPFTFPKLPPKNADKYLSMKLDYKVNPVRTGSQTKQKKAAGKRRLFFSGFGCTKAPCFKTKDVLVHINDLETSSYRASKPDQEIINAVKSMEESRRSIEVFGSGKPRDDVVAKNMERKLSMLTWDAIPKARKNLPTSTVGSSDDVASEASSDLFEIEDISGSMHRSILSPTTSYYAPSEASIQWSVVTADYNEFEGADWVGSEKGRVDVDVAAETRVLRKSTRDQNEKYQGNEFSFSLPKKISSPLGFMLV